MISSSHEAMHRIFDFEATAFARAFRSLHAPFPDPIAVEQVSVDLTETAPVERRADTVLRVTTVEDVFLLVVEAQSEPDPSRPKAWAYFAAFLGNKYDLPVVLTVICNDLRTVEWAESPMELGYRGRTTLTLHPVVFGPHNVPAVTDPAEADADFPLAALSAITHARQADIGAIIEAIVLAVRRRISTGRGDAETEHYVEMIEMGISKSPAAVELWRKYMTTDLSFFRSESAQLLREQGREQGLEQGLEQGREQVREEVCDKLAESVLSALRTKAIAVSTEAERTIARCRDWQQLTEWLQRVAFVTSTDELLGH